MSKRIVISILLIAIAFITLSSCKSDPVYLTRLDVAYNYSTRSLDSITAYNNDGSVATGYSFEITGKINENSITVDELKKQDALLYGGKGVVENINADNEN